jgi:outer membrane protein
LNFMVLRRSVGVLGCVLNVTAFCVIARPVALCAQTPQALTSGKVSLSQVIGEARKNYPAIQAAQAQQRAAQGAIGVARTAYLPKTDLLWQTNRATANNIYGLLLPQGVIPSISGPVIGSDVSRSAWSSGGGALLSWQPFDFGARAANVSAARQGNEAAKRAESLTELQITTGAAGAFFDLAAALQLVDVAKANVGRNEAFDKAVHVLVENLLRPGADASQADAQLALARNQLIQAQTQVAIKQLALADYLNRPGEQMQIEAGPLLNSIPPADVPLAEAAGNPAVLQEEALVRQQQARQRVLDRSYVPQFSALASVSGRGAGADLNGNFPGGTAGLAPDTFNWAAGLQVTFAAFDIFGLREQRKVQQANVQTEQARRSQSLDDVSTAIEQARSTLTGARQMAANTPVELSAAQASEQQQQARYRSGLATVVDVAAAESVLAQAQADDVVALLGVWRAELGIAAAQGDLEPFLDVLKRAKEAN